jgi:RNA polymerase sigma-70 factor (ECF subfamily)
MEVPERNRADLAVMQSEQMAQIQTALQNMDREYANVVMWHYIEDLSLKEIAEILERPEGTVRVMLHRGLKELRALLR